MMKSMGVAGVVLSLAWVAATLISVLSALKSDADRAAKQIDLMGQRLDQLDRSQREAEKERQRELRDLERDFERELRKERQLAHKRKI